MALTSRAVTVTTTATRLDGTTSAASTSAHHAEAQSVAVYNAGAVTVYLGGSDVTTSIGVPVPASTWGPELEIASGDSLYGIVASSTADVRVMEITAG